MEAVVFLFFFLQALIIGAFCYYIAGQKNRNEAGWFILGFLFSFVALLALVAVPKIETVEYRPSLSPTPSLQRPTDTYPLISERPCPFCAETIKAAAKICRFCQRDVGPTTSQMDNAGDADTQTPQLIQSIDWSQQDEAFCTSALAQRGYDVVLSMPTKWSITAPSKGTIAYAYSLEDLQKIARRATTV